MATKAPTIPQYTLGTGGGIPRTDGGNGIPHCWLVGADGKVVYEGHPGSLSSKTIEAELKKVEKPSDEVKQARAAKKLAYAQGLAGEKRFLQARDVMEEITKEAKGTEAAKTAEETLASFKKDDAVKAELKAQEILKKYLGGLELPKEKLSGKDRDGLAVLMENIIKKYSESAPGAAKIAEEWANLLKKG